MTTKAIDLNSLLADAKHAQQGFAKWRRDSGYKPFLQENLLYQSAIKLWTLLYEAMIESVPIELTLANGEIRNARTLGGLTKDLLMYYSETLKDKDTNEGINLQFIASIKKIVSTAISANQQQIARDWANFNLDEFDDLSSEEVEAYSAWRNDTLSRLIKLVKTQEQKHDH